MPDSADQSSSTATLTRRGVLGLGVATIALASCRKLGNDSRGNSAAQIVNQGSVIEFSAAHDGTLLLSSFRNASTHFEWAAAGQAFAPTFNSPLGVAIPWQPLPTHSTDTGHIVCVASKGGIQARLDLKAYGDTGAFRWQQDFRNAGKDPIQGITSISALDLDLSTGLEQLVVHCVRRNGDYSREALPFRDHLEVQGGGWNSPNYTGLIILEVLGHPEFLVLGVQQERGWTFSLDRSKERLRMSVTLDGMDKNLATQTSLAGCPIFIGACGGDLDSAVNLALAHLRTRLLPTALDGAPWVSYNIWSTDAKDVEKNILDEISFAARMGVDLFYLDASWYRGSSTRGTGDWGKGLGSYVEDRSKFPHGLRYLSDQVHAAGMKFGLWVGPNIVDATLVPHEVPQSWLALVDGKPAELSVPTWENKCLQVCLGSTEYAEHLKHSLAKLIEDYNLDWIKWDNSGIPALPARCNRSDHGHNPADGSASALENEYAIFEYLHQKFPSLALEQCGYGSRLDYGLSGTIRANWCSDTCYPASRLRSNSLVCASVYPSAYNAAWIVREDTELFEAKTEALVDAGIRSRMIGLFGVGTLNGQMSQRASLYPKLLLDRLAGNIKHYKRFRHLLFQQVSFPYKPYGTDPHGWQAVQFTDSDGLEAVLLCFRGSSSQVTSRLVLSRLDPQRSYKVKFIDGGAQSTVSGKDLMDTGIFMSLPESGASEILLVNAASRQTV
jgi:alpha-galactosidase